MLWPTVNGGRRFLRRWGVKDPTEEQGLLARRYLLDRRLLYPPLFIAAPFVTGGDNSFWPPLVLALLLAEIIGTLRPVRGPRAAILTRRAWGDLVQRWAVVLMLVLGVFAVVLAVAAKFAQEWGQQVLSTYPPDGTRMPDSTVISQTADVQARVTDPRWLIVIIAVVLATAAVLGIVWLAVRRGSIADLQVDAALRTRSARVAVGIGIAFMATSVGEANRALSILRGTHWPVPEPWLLAGTGGLEALTLPLLFIAATGWIWVANPANRMPYVQSTQT
ncbi:hypothetical protein DMH04_35010 [Kibdelosporangium aridum]|uniref:Uncharacterized protein n=1 Tax=Kibdelosporangium aridum TaxID=2030 RepID=A0A428YZX3_KIBAR|nr:hypothetical protein DMH04_35010 [Kibdelosporangium aridum]